MGARGLLVMVKLVGLSPAVAATVLLLLSCYSLLTLLYLLSALVITALYIISNPNIHKYPPNFPYLPQTFHRPRRLFSIPAAWCVTRLSWWSPAARDSCRWALQAWRPGGRCSDAFGKTRLIIPREVHRSPEKFQLIILFVFPRSTQQYLCRDLLPLQRW